MAAGREGDAHADAGTVAGAADRRGPARGAGRGGVKLVVALAMVALIWQLASFTASHVTDSVLVSVDQARQAATVDGGVTIERSGVYFGTLSGDTAARVQALLNSGHTTPGDSMSCLPRPADQAMREYRFWFSWHGIVTQYIEVSDPRCATDLTTLGVPEFWGLRQPPKPAQWAEIDQALGLAPLPLQP